MAILPELTTSAPRTTVMAVFVAALVAFAPAERALAFHSVTDVSVKKTASLETAGPGETITYTITVTNTTANATTGLISLTDVVPSGTAFVSMSGAFPFAFRERVSRA